MHKKLNGFLFIMIAGMLFSCDKTESPVVVEKPAVSVEDLVVDEGNTDHVINVKLKLSAPSQNNIVLRYSTKDVTATAGSDYVALTDMSTVMKPGETELSIPITIRGDKVSEPDETFELVIISAINATVQKAKAVVTIRNDDAGDNTIVVPATGYVTPESYDGYTLAWRDEFKGSTVDENNWTFEIGNGSNGWGNNELQYYKKENSSIYADDYLMITAKQEQVGSFQYTSSRLVTKGKKEFKYGRVDIRAAMPIGQGIWPALWSLGADFETNPWPNCGEIDIMEFLGHEGGRVYGTAHWGKSAHKSKGSSTLSGSEGNFHEAFHVFSLIWEKDKMEWYVDDKKFFTISTADMEGQPYPFNSPQFFIINCAVGGNWPGSPDGTTVFPQRYFVDYIRVFQKN
jgi:beta-glucanase (GH16 family)